MLDLPPLPPGCLLVVNIQFYLEIPGFPKDVTNVMVVTMASLLGGIDPIF